MVDTSPNSWKLLYESGRQALQDRKLQDAEQSFSAALQLAEDFAAGDPRLVATLNALARIYSLQRRYLAAAALLNRLLEVTERTLGPSHVQVAGVLTNLAEMYTHLGAAREELELRERVLGIRGDDPNADTTSLLRLRERVNELRALLAAQETTVELDEEFEQEPLPTVRTSEYSSPVTTQREPEPAIVPEPASVREPLFSPASASSVTRDDSYRFSPAVAQPSVTPLPAMAAAASTSIDDIAVEEPETFSYDGEPKSAGKASPVVELISIDEQSVVGTIDHGFSDMGRDELPPSVARKIGGRSSLYSVAAGIVLVAGLLAARDYVKAPDDASVSAGSVSANLAAATSARVVVTPVAQAVAPTTPAPAPTPEPRTVERLIADHHADQEPRRATDDAPTERAPRVPSAAELEKTLKSLDAATRAIDQRTKAVTDSANVIRLQTPTFKKVRMADPTTGPVVP